MYCDISRALPKCPWARRRALFYVYLLVLCLQNGWIERSRSWQHPPPPHLSVVHGTRQMWSEWNCQHLFKRKKKNSLCWSFRVAFANVTLAMEPFGRGKEKTNRQVVPIMVFTRHWWASNYRIRACSCTQLWVLLSKFGETENGVQTEARACLCIKAAEPSHVIQCVRWPKNCWGWHLRVLSLLVYYML